MMPTASKRVPRETVEKLRADVDRGAWGDKVPFIDPAAVPLGTDDEAAGQQSAGAEDPGSRQTLLPLSDERGRNISGELTGPVAKLWRWATAGLPWLTMRQGYWLLAIMIMLACAVAASLSS
jgi:hypothetical protein